MIGVIGAGSLGVRLGAQLMSSGYSVALKSRQGWIKEPVAYQYAAVLEQLQFEIPQNMSELDLIFVTVKCYQLPEVLSELESGQTAIILSNGFYDRLLAGLSIKAIIIKAASTLAAYTQEDIVYRADVRGELSVEEGVWSETFRNLAQAEESWIHKADDMQRQKKWVLNCSLNTLCGFKSLLTNGLAKNHLTELRGLFDESLALSEQLFESRIKDREVVWSWLLKTIDLTSNNRNSLMSDLLYRRRTEADFLSGMANEQFPLLHAAHSKIVNAE
ncbi:NAD(P)-binding domain-containing protein [Oligoflexaceae bacterium]|nr:NAD(P)-binding domain-containing protein [Oligoflexaceae bacterium]